MAEETSLENALTELEKMVRELEDGRLGLEESLSKYERGISLIKECYSKLNKAEQRIQQLAGFDEEGNPVLQPFRYEEAQITQTKPGK